MGHCMKAGSGCCCSEPQWGGGGSAQCGEQIWDTEPKPSAPSLSISSPGGAGEGKGQAPAHPGRVAPSPMLPKGPNS